MRAETLGLSIAGHAVLGIVLASLATHDRPAPPTTATTIEIVAAPPDEPVEQTAPAPAASASGAASARSRRPARARTSTLRTVEDPRGAVRVEEPGKDGIGDGLGDGIGDGPGDGGGGRGRGIGLGDGARITAETIALVTPPPPAASKARTARLVYPVREREVDDSELFVARVTIDDEGFVVGAKLVRGFGGPRDAQAADLIWKFRYAPALDDEGRPIRSTFDQRFLVGR